MVQYRYMGRWPSAAAGNDTGRRNFDVWCDSRWLDCVLDQELLQKVVGFCFNLYEKGRSLLVDRMDRDQAFWCRLSGMVLLWNDRFWYRTRDAFLEEAEWDEVLEDMMAILRKYLENGKYADVLKSRRGGWYWLCRGNGLRWSGNPLYTLHTRSIHPVCRKTPGAYSLSSIRYWIIMGCFWGAFTGYVLFIYWNYQKNPDWSVMQSAPWYTRILLYGVITLAVLIVCFIMKRIMRQKSQMGSGCEINWSEGKRWCDMDWHLCYGYRHPVFENMRRCFKRAAKRYRETDRHGTFFPSLQPLSVPVWSCFISTKKNNSLFVRQTGKRTAFCLEMRSDCIGWVQIVLGFIIWVDMHHTMFGSWKVCFNRIMYPFCDAMRLI